MLVVGWWQIALVNSYLLFLIITFNLEAGEVGHALEFILGWDGKEVSISVLVC